MRFLRHRTGPWLLALVVCALLAAAQTPHVLAEQPPGNGGYLWLDIDGQPLPFQDDEAIREVMRSARVVSRQGVGRGVAGTEMLVLESDGTRFHAAFRSVDVSKREQAAGGVRRRPKQYRDAAIFESAAYELSQLLGIGRVPPVVERRFGTEDGTVQIWMEATLPEVELVRRSVLQPPDEVRWHQQKQIMYVFDNLIANRDRNQGNLLIDRSWTLWFIDHTRAFAESSKLLYRDKLAGCERHLWTSLRAVDEGTLRRRLEPYLGRREISQLLRRRLKLIAHIQKLIDKRGDGAVLFDLRSPGPEKADWNE